MAGQPWFLMYEMEFMSSLNSGQWSTADNPNTFDQISFNTPRLWHEAAPMIEAE
jgi:hypothetical protein